MDVDWGYLGKLDPLPTTITGDFQHTHQNGDDLGMLQMALTESGIACFD